MSNKAVFFDRDGCLIVDKHYLHDPSQLEYFDDTFYALKKIQDHGHKIFIVTNQSGIGRGFFTVDQMQAVHEQMLKDFKDQGIDITEVTFCPHTPTDECDCRKPHPKMINDLCVKYQLDKNLCFMIGDKKSDAECGKNASITGCLIYKNSHHYPSFESLSKFADYILKH